MKEMIVCDIEIVTSSSGTRTRYAARGRFYEEGDGFVLCYLQDGDTVRLSVRGQSFCMERRGETEISLSLAEGAAGLFAFAVGGEKGEVPARCDRCLVRSTRDGRRILLRYGLCFGQECQVFRVNIAVKFISEEQ